MAHDVFSNVTVLSMPKRIIANAKLNEEETNFITPLLHFSQSIPAKFFIKGTKLRPNLDRVGHLLFGFVDIRIKE